MKRVVVCGRHSAATVENQALAKEAAVKLLERSIQFGHGRLAVVRLAMAVRSGASIKQDHWDYCRHAFSIDDLTSQTLYQEAVLAAHSTLSTTKESLL